MALANMRFKDQNLVSCLEEENRMGDENGRIRRRGRGREAKQAKVWNFGFLYGN